MIIAFSAAGSIYYGQEIVVKTLEDVVDNNLGLHLNFDSNVNNNGNTATTITGTNMVYEDGVVGSAANFAGSDAGRSYVTIDGYELGTDSFSISFWVKYHENMTSDPIIFGTQDWNVGESQGITIALLKNGNVRINHGDGVQADRFSSSSVGSIMPGEFVNNWVHVTVVFDRENHQYKIAFNFGDFIVFNMPSALYDKTCDGPNGTIMINNDYNGYNPVLYASLDDLAIFEGALDKDDLAALKTYYDGIILK